MKKLLFSLAISAGIAVQSQQIAGDWNITGWDNQSAVTTNVLKKNIAFINDGSADFAVIEGHTPNPAFDSGSYTKRLKTGGSSYSNSNPANPAVPTKRHLYFQVNGPSEIKVYFRGSGGSSRTLYITDGTNVLNSMTTADSSNNYTLTANYTGTTPTNIYIAGNNGFGIYEIVATNVGVTELPPTMSVGDVKSEIKTNAFSSGNKVFISNLENKNTEVKVYSATGQLVKTLKTSTDTSFEINKPGVYIVNLKSVAGEKSTKILVK